MASLTVVSDETLVARVADRDRQARAAQEALALLYDRYRSVIFALALRILKDRAEAEECLVDVFLQAWRQAPGFDAARGSVTAWLITLCRSRAIDRSRAVGRRETLMSSFAEESIPAGGGSPFPGATGRDPESLADLALKRERIDRALGELTPDQKRAIELAYYEGLSHSEIAERLDTPLGTVKTRIRSGIVALRNGLQRCFPT